MAVIPSPLDPPGRLPVHPLVVGLTAAARMPGNAPGASWYALSVADAKDSLKAVAAAAQSAFEKSFTETAYPGAPSEADCDDFSKAPNRPRYTILAGYLGGCYDGGQGIRQVLYADAMLARWLLVPLVDIALFNRVEDKSAAFGQRDVLWLKSDVRVVRGNDSESVQRNYLNGPFIRADELGSTANGDTLSNSSGLICEAVTPGCCTSRSQRR